MEKWNRNDWQGRSEENVKFSYKATGYTLLSMVAVAVISILYIIITAL
jgi:hypothetical protein